MWKVQSSNTYSLHQLHDCIYRNLTNHRKEIIEYEAKKISIFDKSIDEFGNYAETQINNLVKAFIEYKTHEAYKN